MCGIAGIFDLEGARDIDRDALTRMTRALAHRGPDGEGFHIAPGVGLGHRRLAVIDAEGGVQPYFAQARPCVLVYNGEIYNYRDIAEEISERTPLRTRSDTEVLAESWALDGAAALDRMRGMFAFAIWDPDSQTLSLARDRMGERPLYYTVTPDRFLVFASELSALTAARMAPMDIDPKALADYFAYGFVPDPLSIYRGVYKLPPASLLEIRRGRPVPEPRTWWRMRFAPDPAQEFEAAAAGLRDMLDEAVATQLVSDAPLGAFLSGGVDSSSIVAAMAQARGAQVRTCAIGFNEDRHDERAHARKVADLFHTDHRERMATIEAHAMIDRVAQAYGEPFADSSALPTFMVCGLAREAVTVALSGDGGDEVFAGYRRYPFFLREEGARAAMPAPVRKAVFGALGAVYPQLDGAPRMLRAKTTFQSLARDASAAYFRAIANGRPESGSALLSQDLRARLSGYDPAHRVAAAFEEADTDDPLSMAQYADARLWLPGRMLVKVDRAAMAHSLETRTPFLDHRLVEWAARLPATFKLRGGEGKRILKASQSERLPRDILHRRKQGFALPVSEWLRAEAHNPLDRLTESGAWKESGLIDPAAAEKMAQAHRAGAADHAQPLWALVMFDAFLRAARA